MNQYNPWSPQAQSMCLQMNRSGANSRMIADRIGKSPGAVRRWLYNRRIANGDKIASYGGQRMLGLPQYTKPDVPQSVLDDRDRRYAEVMTLNMLLLGDPVPQQSALRKVTNG